jgi:hypothetical protein
MNDDIILLVDPEFDLSSFLKELKYPNLSKNDLLVLFSVITDSPYLVRSYSQCKNLELLNWLFEMKVPRRNIFIRSQVLPFYGFKKTFKWYSWLRKDLLLYADGSCLSVYYTGNIKENLMQDLFSIIESRFKKEDFLNCIYYIDNFLNASPKLLRLSDKLIDPSVHFNDDIKDFEEKVISNMEPDDATGIIILAGNPGNGQSVYLHYLTRVLNRRFLYLSKWDAPGFDLEMMEYMEYKRPLLILEDADEYVNHTNKLSENSLGKFVKDLLHGDIIKKIKHMPVIITLNYPLSHYPKLDQSDSGYILVKYEFKPLEVEKARALKVSLSKSLEINGPTSLHDIFHSQ